jgi:hypothetical protein
MGRSARAAVTLAVLAALVSPVVLDADGLPLSTYPMYSRARPDESTIYTAQRVVDGERTSLGFEVIGASDDPLVVAGELRSAVGAGRADDRCAEIADRAAEAGLAEPGDRIEVVSERHDTVTFVSGGPSLVERIVRAECEVPG